ncbi:hypothetical protein H5410_030579 [Solanum commersonii]|uniref:CCHC-type domain-containing protein n=1 Tax=Solanum commersonii TaxID=4109 RepID=A0A9J5YG35_SOLCO|nr:hypothetical protein H5410_030579 [Solanum commersonii]
MEEKASIINAMATDDGVDNLGMALVRNIEYAVYTLVLTILEHFNAIRIGITGPPELKVLTGKRDLDEGPKKNAKIERAIVNLIYLPRISGRDLSKVECYKCGQLGHITPNCKLNKLKTLELDGETYEKVYGLLYTSGSADDYESNSGSVIELLDLSDNDKNCDSPCTTCQGNTCNCEDDEIYKLQLQLQDFNMNTITSDNVIELLKEVTDNKFREKIINLATSNEASSSSSKLFENKKNDLNDFEYSAPYSLKEVDDRLIKRNAFPKKDSSFDDLKVEIEN